MEFQENFEFCHKKKEIESQNELFKNLLIKCITNLTNNPSEGFAGVCLANKPDIPVLLTKKLYFEVSQKKEKIRIVNIPKFASMIIEFLTEEQMTEFYISYHLDKFSQKIRDKIGEAKDNILLLGTSDHSATTTLINKLKNGFEENIIDEKTINDIVKEMFSQQSGYLTNIKNNLADCLSKAFDSWEDDLKKISKGLSSQSFQPSQNLNNKPKMEEEKQIQETTPFASDEYAQMARVIEELTKENQILKINNEELNIKNSKLEGINQQNNEKISNQTNQIKKLEKDNSNLTAELYTYLPPKSLTLIAIHNANLNSIGSVSGRGLAMNPNFNRFAVVCKNGVVECRDDTDGSLLFQKHLELGRSDNGLFNSVAWSPDGNLLAVSGCSNLAVNILDGKTGDLKSCNSCANMTKVIFGIPLALNTPKHQAFEIWRILWLNNNKLLVGFNNNELVIFDINPWKVIVKNVYKQEQNESDLTQSLALVGKKILLGTQKGHLICLKQDLTEKFRFPRHHSGKIRQISVNSASTYIATASEDRTIALFSWSTETDIFRCEFEEFVDNIIWGPSEKCLICHIGSIVQRFVIIDAKKGQVLGDFQDQSIFCFSMILSKYHSNVMIATTAPKAKDVAGNIKSFLLQ